MREVRIERRFESWRDAARRLLVAQLPPQEIVWVDSAQSSLFGGHDEGGERPGVNTHSVPKEFIELSKLVACHRDPQRWAVMYRLLWRLTHGQHNLLEIETDDDVRAARAMEKQVSRDRHKMHAFVRFRKIVTGEGERFVAWHRPDHYILRLATPFFVDRFRAMHWTILTPDESAMWDTRELSFGPGVPQREAPTGDQLEELWKTYYASTYNPSRTSVKTMKREMPVRHWRTMPEAELIPGLIGAAKQRTEEMCEAATAFESGVTAARFIPRSYTLPQLREAVKTCKGCELHCHATQAVFGEGPEDAPIVFVGEQPGDQEDLMGRPFVGPAGQLFDELLIESGIERRQAYVTNVVKHFKYETRGKRRIHSTPNARDVAACRPWLEAELSVVKPKVLVCLGATAARALIAPGFSITHQRGEIVRTKFCECTIATYHPSALLRIPDEGAKREARSAFLADLRTAVDELKVRRVA